MNSKNTWLLVLLALGLFAFIWFERSIRQETSGPAKSTRLLPQFNPDRVDEIQVTLQTNRMIRAERTGNRWTLTEPIGYPAKGPGIEALLFELSELKRRYFIPEKEIATQPEGLSGFGLDPPQATVRVSQNNRRTELHIGAKTAVGNQVYIQLAGDDGILATGTSLLERVPQSADDWRDPSLITLDESECHRLRVKAGARSFTVDRNPTNDHWRITQPMEARASSSKIEGLIKRLKSWQIQAFVTDNPQADLESYGLESPQLELVLGQGDDETVVVQFGKHPANHPERVYARRMEHTNIVEVDRAQLEPLRATYTAYRDTHLLSEPMEQIDRIQVKADETFTLERQNRTAWRIVEPIETAADSNLVQEFLNRLYDLRIAGFPKDAATDFDFANYGLAPPSRQYTLQQIVRTDSGTTNQILAQLNFGTNQMGQVFARRADENSVYAMTPFRLPTRYYELRDRTLWQFDPENVTRMQDSKFDQTMNFVRDAEGDWQVAEGGEGLINQGAMKELLTQLGRLTVEEWVSRKESMWNLLGFPSLDHQWQIQVGSGDQTRTYSLAFGKFAPSGNPYAATEVDGERTIFEFPQRLYLVYQEAVRDISFTSPENNSP